MEYPFEELNGVTEVIVGYTGGHQENPTYEEVTTGKTGHDEQKRLAEESKERLQKSGEFQGAIVTKIIKSSEFYKAEDYNLKYYQKFPIKYKLYRTGSGRDAYLELKGVNIMEPNYKNYNKPSEEEFCKPINPFII